MLLAQSQKYSQRSLVDRNGLLIVSLSPLAIPDQAHGIGGGKAIARSKKNLGGVFAGDFPLLGIITVDQNHAFPCSSLCINQFLVLCCGFSNSVPDQHQCGGLVVRHGALFRKIDTRVIRSRRWKSAKLSNRFHGPASVSGGSLRKRQLQSVLNAVGKQCEQRLIGRGSLVVLRQTFVVVPLDLQLIYTRQIGRKVQCPFGFLLTLLLISQLCPSSSQHGMGKRKFWIIPDRLLQKVLGRGGVVIA